MMRVLWIDKVERGGNEISIGPGKPGAKEDTSVCGIVARKFHDFYLTIVIDRENLDLKI